jgi:hypothetical protein
LRSTKVLLMQYELPMPALIKAAQIANQAGARIVVDPAPARPTPTRGSTSPTPRRRSRARPTPGSSRFVAFHCPEGDPITSVPGGGAVR